MLELRGPVVAALELTSAGCALSVPHAQASLLEETRSLSSADWGRVIDRLAPFITEVRVLGAEPGLRADLFDVLSHLERVGKPYHLFTQGLWNERPRVLLALKQMAWLQSVVVDIHGVDAASHEACLRGLGLEPPPDAFGEALKTIEAVCSTGIEVSTRSLITRHNAAQVEAMVEDFMRRGTRHAIFSRYVGSPRPELEPGVEGLKGALRRLEELKQLGYNVALGSCVPSCFFSGFSQGCSGGISYCVIDPAGRMRPCDHSPTVVGSLLEKGVTDLWRSRAMRAWRNRLPVACKNCSKVTFCPGGCRSLAENLDVACDPLVGDPLPPEEPTLLEVTLEEDLCPVPRYTRREEDFGWALIRQTHVIPATRKAGALLDSFDGRTTLADIEKKHGSGALSFVYSLYERNFVDFRTPPEGRPDEASEK